MFESLFTFTLASPLSDAVLALARVIAGVTMLYYGLPKLKDLGKNARNFVEMGFRPGWFWGTLVVSSETVGSLALIFGIFTWLAALMLAVHMTVGTVWKITQGKNFPDYSYDMLLVAIALLLLAFGPGIFSVETLIS